MYLKVSDETDEAFELCKKAADTAAAHIVGALDRPILTLLPYFQIIASFLIHIIALGIHQYAFCPGWLEDWLGVMASPKNSDYKAKLCWLGLEGLIIIF